MKKILKIIFIGILCWYTYINYIEFKKNDIFKIVKVKVAVENKELVSDLLKDLKELKGQNILEIDEEEIKEKLLEDVRIDHVTITKNMPDVLSFKIHEKIPFTYIEYKGNIYIADEKGIIFGYMKESDKFNMPLMRISSEDDIKEFIKILKKIVYSDSISQIYRTKNGIVVTIDNGMKLITDLDVESEKYNIVKKIYNIEKEKSGKIKYIDLRFDDYIIKKAKGDQR